MHAINIFKLEDQIIVGKYCVLEPLNLSIHGDELFLQFCGKNDVFLNNLYGPFDNYADFEKWLRAEAVPMFSFVVKYENQVSGLISIHSADEYNALTEIGVTLGHNLQNTTAATEAIYLVLETLFVNYNYRRIQWHCTCRNIGSINAAKRFFFSEEARCRNFYIHNNEQLDGLYFSILDEEWVTLREKYTAWLYGDGVFDVNGKQLKKLNPDYKKITYYPSSSYKKINDWESVTAVDINGIKINNYQIRQLDIIGDAAKVFDFIQENPEAFSFKNYGNFKNVEELIDWFNKFNKIWEHYVVLDNTTGEIVSILSSIMIAPDSGIVELYLLMATSWFLENIFPIFLQQFEQVAFSNNGYQRLQILSNCEDIFVANILQTNNFVNEGILRKYMIINNCSYDMIMWSKTITDNQSASEIG